MGVSAVPGSGKTQTLSALAARIIASGRLAEGQEVLIVTLVNAAVDNFAGRVSGIVKTHGWMPRLGYRVRTLHGLAHDIVSERPELVSIGDRFEIIDEREADQILQDAVYAWLQANPDALDNYLAADLSPDRRVWVRKDRLPDLIIDVTRSFIKQAKDLCLLPQEIAEQLGRHPFPLPLAEMGVEIYHNYQRALIYRGAVDFADLIRLAIRALKADPEFLQRLQYRWPYILEDEAQDSSRLQEEILRLLTGPEGNWVRVGDPNQAIYETFTTATPLFLRAFLKQPDVYPVELPNSGRSTLSIISLANRLIEWVQQEHPVRALRDALAPPFIEPSPPDDPQPNPIDDPAQVHIHFRRLTPADEIKVVVDSLKRWLPEHPSETVAVLVPRNTRGYRVAEALRRQGIPFVEILQSTQDTRLAAGALTNVLKALADPISPAKLAMAFRVWRRAERHDQAANVQTERLARHLEQCRYVETYLWPTPDASWLAGLNIEPGEQAILETFRQQVQRWQAATQLPVDQLLLIVAQDLFDQPADLALAHKLALLLKRISLQRGDRRLEELAEELKAIALNRRRFLGFSKDDAGFDPERYKGQVLITTMHKAKGLEWDRVYLMSVNNYNFPSAMEGDSYISEKWFVRHRLNLEAETLAQLEALLATGEYQGYTEGQATMEARLSYAAERLRLLYVGITRARKELIITWNSGKDGTYQPAVPLVALQKFLEARTIASEGQVSQEG